MEIRLLSAAEDSETYRKWVGGHPQGSLWQSVEWKQYQEALGRETRVYVELNGPEIVASALVIIDRTSFGFCTWDVPRGPLFESRILNTESWEALLEKIIEDAKREKCLSIYTSPQSPLEIQDSEFKIRESGRHEQPDATRIVDLTKTEDEILTQMHQKGRYNIKVAQKHAVQIVETHDARPFATLLESTAERDGFRGPSARQLTTMLKNLPGCFLLLSYAPDNTQEPIGGLLGVVWHGTAIYYYGGSDYAHRALMAPYLLQWEAMRRSKAAGCVRYDLLGVAPPDAPEDHLWQGISGFKEKFGGEVIVYPHEQEVPLRPWAKRALWMKRKMLG